MKSTFFLLTILFSWNICKSQDITPLKIGDAVPETFFKQVINYKDSTINVRELKGKALLLDFWGTWCVPCVEAIPNLQRIQDKYKSDLVIVTISSEKKQIVQSFFSRINGTKLITATGDNSIWSLYFPHRFVPHEIWIDKNGIVKGITGHKEVTDGNIDQLISGKTVGTGVPEIPANNKGRTIASSAKVDYNVMSLMEGNNMGNIQSFSAFTNYLPGKMNSMITGPKRLGSYPLKDRRFFAWNIQPIVIYKAAYGYEECGELWSAGRVIIEIKDSFKWEAFTKKGKATDSDLVCYSALIPASNGTPLYKKVQNDLINHFGVIGTFQWRNVECYALQVTDQTKLKTMGGKPAINESALFFQSVNSPVSKLAERLSFYNENFGAVIEPKRKIIIDETDGEKADLELKGNMKDLEEINSQLNRYGLRLRKKIAKVKMLVLTDEYPLEHRQ